LDIVNRGNPTVLIHTDLDGKRDLAPSEAVRIYHFAGTQHGPGNLVLTDTGAADDSRGQQGPNSVDYRPLLRAAREVQAAAQRRLSPR